MASELGFTFTGREAPSLADVSFELAAGTWTLVAGRTGSGKSTLLRALAGLIPHHTAGQMRGAISLFGRDTRGTTPAALAGKVGLVLQSPDDQVCTTSVEAELAFGLENMALPPAEIARRIAEALAQAGLQRHAASRTSQLSGGEKQRLVLTCILAMQPRLVLLDEPLSQLDPQAASELLARLDDLRSQGITLVIAEHRLDDLLPRVDRVLVLDGGRLLASCDTGPASAAGLNAALEAGGLALPEIVQLAIRVGHDAVRTAEQLAGLHPQRVIEPVESIRPAPARIDAGQPVGTNRRVLLRAEGLEHRFAGAPQPLWSGVSFSLHAGERVALVGPNGAGKSTLLAELARRLSPRGAPATCGLVPQNPDLALFCRTVGDELSFAPRHQGRTPDEVRETVAWAAERLAVADLLAESPLALSRGQRLRVAVAAALSMRPNVLLLDEPTTAQDYRHALRVLQAAGDALGEGGLLVFSTHDLRAAARCADRVLVLAGQPAGPVAASSTGQLAGPDVANSTRQSLLADCTCEELLSDDALLRAASLRRPPLWELRRRLGFAGATVEALEREWRA